MAFDIVQQNVTRALRCLAAITCYGNAQSSNELACLASIVAQGRTGTAWLIQHFYHPPALLLGRRACRWVFLVACDIPPVHFVAASTFSAATRSIPESSPGARRHTHRSTAVKRRVGGGSGECSSHKHSARVSILYFVHDRVASQHRRKKYLT